MLYNVYTVCSSQGSVNINNKKKKCIFKFVFNTIELYVFDTAFKNFFLKISIIINSHILIK